MGVTYPVRIGGFISAFDSDSISGEIDVDGIPIGTNVWNEDVGDFFTLKLSSASLVPDEILQVKGIDGARWIKYSATDAAHADTADVATTADGPTATATFTAALSLATNSEKGLVNAGQRAAILRKGTNLTGADQTIQPYTDKCGMYILPPATQAGNAILTVGETGSPPAGTIVQIVIQDISANTYTVKDGAGNTLYTKGASPGQAKCVELYLSGGTNHWVLNGTWWVE